MSIFFTKENQTLYPATWEYNALLIIDELATIIENNGGRVKPGYRAGYIQNRSIDNAIIEYQARAERIAAAIDEYPDSGKNGPRRAALVNLNADIEKLKQIDNAPRRIEHDLYLSFVIDSSYYYMQLDENPFFEFYYQKTPIKNGRYSADVYLTELEKTWLYDCFFMLDCAAADRREAANLIYNILVNAPYSEIHREYKKERVNNLYDGGYHYETIKVKERFNTLDF